MRGMPPLGEVKPHGAKGGQPSARCEPRLIGFPEDAIVGNPDVIGGPPDRVDYTQGFFTIGPKDKWTEDDIVGDPDFAWGTGPGPLRKST